MAYGARDKDAAVLTKWSAKVLRETLYDAEPPELRAETRERIIATLRQQARRGGPPSYLMRNAERLYGIRPEEWL